MISVIDMQPFNAQFKLTLEEAVTADARRDAEFIIRGTLSNTIAAATLALWEGADTTPEWIRAAGGRLAFALFYGARYSDEDTTYQHYSQNLYNEGMAMLKQVVTGDVSLPAITTSAGGQTLTTDMFTATEPVFTMADVF